MPDAFFFQTSLKVIDRPIAKDHFVDHHLSIVPEPFLKFEVEDTYLLAYSRALVQDHSRHG
jgi:hypothetical protein